jgi:hypothetical protein
VIISAAPITVTNDPKRWMVFVNAAKGESIVLCGLVNKPNPVGVPLLRQLILTSHKRLIYVDANSLELKGTIEWKKKKAIEPLLLLVRVREVRRLRVTCGGSWVTFFRACHACLLASMFVRVPTLLFDASDDHFAHQVNSTTFEVQQGVDGKIYKFITKDDLTAQHWVDAIDSVNV